MVIADEGKRTYFNVSVMARIVDYGDDGLEVTYATGGSERLTPETLGDASLVLGLRRKLAQDAWFIALGAGAGPEGGPREYVNFDAVRRATVDGKTVTVVFPSGQTESYTGRDYDAIMGRSRPVETPVAKRWPLPGV